MNPNSPHHHLQSQRFQYGQQSRKIMTPYLHQLPFVTRGIETPGLFTPRATGVTEAETSKEDSCDGIRSLRLTEALQAKELKKPTTQAPVEELQPSKQTKMRVAKLLQRKEPNPTTSKVVNGNLMELIPKMKAKKLKDRIVLLKRAAIQKDHEEDQRTSGVFDTPTRTKHIKSKSTIPDEFLGQRPAQEFKEVLQDFLFKKKGKLCLLEQPQEFLSPRVSIFSPNNCIKSPKEQKIVRASLNSPSQSQKPKRGSIYLPSPSSSAIFKPKDSQPSLSKLKSEVEFSRELEIFLENDKPSRYHHRRVASLEPQQPFFIVEKINQNLSKPKPKLGGNRLTTSGQIDFQIEGPSPIMESELDSPYLNFGERVNEVGKMSTSALNFFTDSRRSSVPNIVNISQHLPPLEKSTTNFHLKIRKSTTKEELTTRNTLSTESRKLTLPPTTCSTKRKVSIEKQQKKICSHEDQDLLNLVHSIRESSHK